MKKLKVVQGNSISQLRTRLSQLILEAALNDQDARHRFLSKMRKAEVLAR